MQSQDVVHFLLFVVLFSIGAVALGGAVLCDDLILYCQNKQRIEDAEQSLERLASLSDEYDALLANLQSDPNLLKRIAPATLGTEPEDPNVVYPRVKAKELAVARKTLLEQSERESTGPVVPKWLERCSEPRRKMGLFIAGAGLILISLVFFTRDSNVKSRPAGLKRRSA